MHFNKIRGKNSVMRQHKVNRSLNSGKGLVYNESIVSDMGKFTLKFYLFKANSNQELSKTIEEKSK